MRDTISRTRVVIFFGSDGTGKTTQAKLLTKRFNEEGYKVSRAWIRGRHSLAFLISQLLLKLGYKGYFIAPYAPGGKILDSRTLPGKRIWSLIEFVSVVPLIIRRVYLPLMLGRSVIAERYVIDTIVYDNYYIGSAFHSYARILSHMIPKDSLLVHLDARESDAMSRRLDDLVSRRFIEYQLESYRTMASRLQALSINTSVEGIEGTNRRILQRLSEKP